MDKQLVVFYLKRHVIGIVGLFLAIGFGAGGFMMMGKAKDAVEGAEGKYAEVIGRRDNMEKGQALGGSQGVKVDDKNVDAANNEAEIHRQFIKNAGEVVQEGTVDPMTTGEFMVHMANVIEELNKRATEALVEIQRDKTNVSTKILYNFTFMMN